MGLRNDEIISEVTSMTDSVSSISSSDDVVRGSMAGGFGIGGKKVSFMDDVESPQGKKL